MSPQVPPVPEKKVVEKSRFNSKEKGSEYEREMGKALSLWLTKGLKEDCVTRTEGSGARFTNVGKGAPGDLTCCHPLSYPFFEKFIIECKFWRDIEMLEFILKKGDLYWYFVELIKQCDKCERLPFMIVRQNYRPSLIICPSRPVLAIMPVNPNFNYHLLFAERYYMSTFDDFLKLDPDGFVAEARVNLEGKFQ